MIHQPWSVITPPVDGADSVALLTDKIARRLAADHDVTCYCRMPKHTPPVVRHEGVEYRSAPVSIDRWVKLAMQQLDRRGLRSAARPFFASSWCYRQFIRSAVSDMRRRDFDIVHVQNFSQFLPLIRRKLPRAGIVIQMHCEWLNQLDESMIHRRLQSADRVLAVSDYLAARVRRRFPDLAPRVGHVYNGAEIEQFAADASISSSDPNRILYVGRLSPEKGIHTLLDAFAAVVASRPAAHLELIGPMAVVPYEMIVPFCDDPKLLEMAPLYRKDAYARLLHEKIATLPPGSVTLHDSGMEHSALPARYRQAGIFAFPSIWDEPFGMPLVEAMSASLPVVATHGGAFPEIVEDGRTGLLVDRGNPAALAAALLDLLDDPARAREMGAAGARRAAELFTWDRITADLLEQYERAVEAAPSIHHVSSLAVPHDIPPREASPVSDRS